jgi:peptide/nickel transport system substrate-binding protein
MRTERATLTRRTTLRLILSAGGLGVLAACAAPASAPAPTTAAAQPPVAPTATAPAATAAPAATPGATAVSAPAAAQPAATSAPVSAAPKSGGTLRFGQVGDIVNLEPHFNQNTTSENTWLAYDRLTAYDTNWTPQPMLAEKWDLSPDARQIKVDLRKGVQFHNGRELTSDDVKYTFERIRDPKVGVGQYALQGQWFQTVETPDKYTVILTSDQPRPLVFDLFESLNIVDQQTIESPDAAMKSNGTGPFAFVEWAQGDHATWASNKNYWQTGHPYLDTIETRFFKDATALTLQLEAGALDAIRFPSKDDFVRLTADPNFKGLTYPSNVSAYAVGAGVYTPPLDRKAVRQALNYAIDRNRFVDAFLKGVGTPLSLPWDPAFPMYDASKVNYYTFDLDKAKSLLTQEGISDLHLEMIPSPTFPEGGSFCQMYQNDLAKIGVTLDIINLDQATWSDQVNNRKYRHLYFAASILNLSPGTIFSVSRPIGPQNNNEGYQSEQYSQLVNDLVLESDPQKLKQIYTQLNDILLDESFFMFIAPNAVLTVTKSNVQGVTPNMHGGWSLTNAYVG